MTEAVLLAADVGRTTCRVARYDHGRRGGVTATACGWSLADAAGVAGIGAALRSCIARLTDDPAGVAAVCVGTSGAAQDPEGAQELAEQLQEHLDGARVLVTSDVVVAHAGGLAGRPGVVMVAGTGAVALAITADGSSRLVDGAGWLLGDAGGGVQIGRAGLAAALRHHDGRPGASPALAEAARRRFGPLARLPEVVQGEEQPARVLAGFVPDVAAAARAGDGAAAAIFASAVGDLADTAVTACRTLAEPEVAVTVSGGLFDLDDLVAAPFRAAVTATLPHAEVREPAGDALEGAHRLLADGRAGLHRQLVLHVPATRRSPGDGSRTAPAAPLSTRREEA